MVGFYEERANFAAMSEDDGFLGQCAGEGANLAASPAQQSPASLSHIVSSRRGPRQLQLLAIPSLDADRTP